MGKRKQWSDESVAAVVLDGLHAVVGFSPREVTVGEGKATLVIQPKHTGQEFVVTVTERTRQVTP